MKRLFAACAVSMLFLAACGSDNNDVSTSIRQVNDSCPSSSLKTGAAAGASCTTASDCAEVCCPCSGSSKGYGAQACVEGKCASTSDACAKALSQAPSGSNTCQ